MKKDIVVFRCTDCIKDLKEYNPYIYNDGTPIPLDKIEIIEVTHEFCENNEKNLNNNLQKRINLKELQDKPYLVKFWETEYHRNQGLSTILEWYDNYYEAYKEAYTNAHFYDWAAFEVCIEINDEEYAIYTYARTEPFADNFNII